MSSYELIAFHILENLSKVQSYQVNAVCIKYVLNNKPLHYLVDLFVYYTDGTKELIEVKANWKMNHEKEKTKFKAAQEYANRNNLKFSVWTEDVLKGGIK